MSTAELGTTARPEAFEDRVVRMMNEAAVAIMTSIGHRAGLFDAMAGLPPSTSAGIAEAASLDERYVREWLGAMVTGGVVEYDPAGERYLLPTDRAACLTRAAAPNNLAVFTQYIPLLGSVEDGILECFRNGGGVPYDAFHRFHEVMAEDSGQTVLPALLETILPLAPGLPEALSRGIDVLDIGCGSGRALNLMARSFPLSRFTGYDFSEEAVGRARAEAKRHSLDNVRFDRRDVAALEEAECYDLVTAFDAIHDQARPAVVLGRVHRALRPGGTFLMQDIGGSGHLQRDIEHPLAPLLYTVSTMHCMTVSLAQGGEGLGTMWGRERAGRMLEEAGFEDISVHDLPHDIQNCYFVSRRP